MPTRGQAFGASVTVENLGTVASPATILRAVTSRVYDGYETYVAPCPLDDGAVADVPPLEVSASATVNVSGLSVDESGPRMLLVFVDPSCSFKEARSFARTRGLPAWQATYTARYRIAATHP